MLAKPYRVESRAFSSISRQTACTRTVGIPREIVRLVAFLREDTRSRGFARDSCFRILSRANAINNFGREIHSSGPLYLAPLRKERDWSRTQVWFSCQPIGANGINNFMISITKQGGLDVTYKQFTNHSVRKTSLRSLRRQE